MSRIEFRGVSKSYGTLVALQPCDLDVRSGEFLTLLGPSGSGKTTLLNTVAGHLQPTAGRIFINGQDVTDRPARSRKIGMVFQNYALFPHLNVAENVAYGLRIRKVRREERERRVAAALDLMQLGELAGRSVQQLSGGQQQRVALARAIVIEPDMLLLDEPMGALDRQLRKNLQLELRALHRKLGHTTLYVTHDQEEALVLSDRIAVFRAGRLVQVGHSRDLYLRPANEFVAKFLGESNLFEGKIASVSSDAAILSSPQLRMEIQGEAAGLMAGGSACALLRPEKILITGVASGRTTVTVREAIFLGEVLSLRLALASGFEIWARALGEQDVEIGTTVGITWRDEDVRIIPADKTCPAYEHSQPHARLPAVSDWRK